MATTKVSAEWVEIEKIISGIMHDPSAVNKVLLYGPPGTGKTYLGNMFGLMPEQKVYNITLTPETPSAELRGHYIPHGDRFVWHDGPATGAWRTGGRLVLNEIGEASADALTFLHNILDDPQFARLMLPTQEEIRPAKGFSCIATTNMEDPMRELPPALADRFAIMIYVDRPNPKAVAQLPKDLQKAATETAALSDDNRRIGLRSWMAFAALRDSLKDEQLAAKAVFGDRAKDVITGLKVGKVA